MNTTSINTLVRPITTILVVMAFIAAALYEVIGKQDTTWGAALMTIASSIVSYWFGERAGMKRSQ